MVKEMNVDNTYQPQCSSKHITFWAIFLGTKGLWLLFGAVLSILTRNVAKEYSESKSIAYAVSFFTFSSLRCNEYLLPA